MDRRAGILLHPTSLPGPGPAGDLGEGAVHFLDWLQRAGVGLWQILPLNPPGGGGLSPYSSPSALAAGTHLLSLERLAADGLLDGVDLQRPPHRTDRVDVEALRSWHAPRVRVAATRLAERDPQALDDFRAAHPWVDDWALFRALSHRHPGAGWWSFPRALRERDPAALGLAREELREEIQAEVAGQVLFHRQWGALRAAAHERGIRIVGDLPIFVARDGCDTWVQRDHFRGALDPQGDWAPDPVTGVPPDYFSPTGQHWGNPHYAWDVHQASGFRWWIDRFRATFELVDAVRVDHFRGFAAAWEIPASAQGDARQGAWAPAPGHALFAAVREAIGGLPLIAEDLGHITPEVHALRDDLELPGMKILQFAFGGEPNHIFLPHTWAHPRWVVYTGTHDNDTVRGWYASTDEGARDRYRIYAARDGHEPHWDLIRLAWASVASWAVAPMQDVLGLGSEARMNTPGRSEGNWTWRTTELPDHAAARLGQMSWIYGRRP